MRRSIIIIFVLSSMVVFSQSVGFYYNRGTERLERKDYENAIIDFKEVLSKKKDYYEAYNDMGKAYMGLNKYTDAIKSFTSAIKLKNDYFSAYLLRSDCYLKTNKKNSAMKDMASIIKIKPTYIPVYEKRGDMYYTNKNYKKAEADYKKAVELNTKRGLTYYNLAEIQHKTDIDAAIINYKKTTVLSPKNSKAFKKLGNIYYNKKKYNESISYLGKAVALEDYSKETLKKIADSYFKLEKYNEAEKAYSKVLKIYHLRDKELYSRRGQCYVEQKKYVLAVKDFNKSIAYDRSYVDAYFHRAYANSKLNKEKLAVRDFTKALQLNPKCYRAYEKRGKYYFETQKYKLALTDFNAAIKNNPKPDAKTIYMRGACYSNISNMKAACIDLKKASEMGYEPAKKDFKRNCYGM